MLSFVFGPIFPSNDRKCQYVRFIQKINPDLAGFGQLKAKGIFFSCTDHRMAVFFYCFIVEYLKIINLLAAIGLLFLFTDRGKKQLIGNGNTKRFVFFRYFSIFLKNKHTTRLKCSCLLFFDNYSVSDNISTKIGHFKSSSLKS